MIFQVGGSISFSPKTDEAKAKWLSYDTRHMLTELDPKPDCVTVSTGTTLWDVVSMMSKEDIKGTHLADPKVQAAWAGMVVDPRPPSTSNISSGSASTRFQPTSCRRMSTRSSSSSA